MSFIPRRPPRHLLRLLVLLATATLLYFYSAPVFNAAARSLIRVDAPAPADVVIALGGDARCMRERRAAEIFNRGLARHVIVSGVPYAWGVHTGDAAKRYVESLGVPAERITVLRDSWNTRREAMDVNEMMRAQGWNSAILVTSPFHSRRAHYTFRRYAAEYTFISMPLEPEPPEWQPDRWWSRRGDLGITVREYLSWINTLAGGWR